MSLGKFMNKTTPLVIGHRGSPAKRPENTLASFEEAVRDGADMIEYDVQLSADGVALVIHDADLARTTSGEGQVWQGKSEAIRALDAGSWFGGQYGDARVPTLDEVLSAFGRRILMNIELKPECVCRPDQGPGGVILVVEMVRAAGLFDRVLFSSFSFDALRVVRTLAAEANIAVLTNGLERGVDPVLLCQAIGAIACNPDIEYLEKSTVERLQRAGLAVLPYGGGQGDQVEAMKKALTLDCDGFFANDPEAWAKLIGR